MRERFGLTGILTILGFLLLLGAFVLPFIIDKKFAEVFGDSATPLVSAAAFLLLISANIMNQHELKLQREELALQRDELKKTTQALNEQHKTMEKQRFETTFFNLLNSHLEIKKQISTERNGRELTGVKGLEDLYLKIRDAFINERDLRINGKSTRRFSGQEERMEHYSKFVYKEYNDQLFTFASSFTNIFSIISDSENQDIYKRIILSQTTKAELKILFYLAFSDGEIKSVLKDNNWLGLNSDDLIEKEHFDRLVKS